MNLGYLQVNDMPSTAKNGAEVKAKEGEQARTKNPSHEQSKLCLVSLERLLEHSDYFA